MIMIKSLLFSLLLSCSWSVIHAQDVIQPVALAQALKDGEIQILIDVRSLEEWITGHVANATLVANLATEEFPTMALLTGCEACTIAIMCRTGERAASAITRLQTDYGFTGTIYNALGVSQWVAEGLPLVVNVNSNIPSCSTSGTTPGVCPASSFIDTGVEMVKDENGDYVPKYSLTAEPNIAPTVAPAVPAEDTTPTVATEELTPTPAPVVISIPSVQGNEGATVDRAQQAQSSTTKRWVVEPTTITLVGMVLLSLGVCSRENKTNRVTE